MEVWNKPSFQTPAEVEDIMKGPSRVDETEEWNESSKMQSSDQMAAAIRELSERITSKKAALAPIIKGTVITS